MNVRRELPIHAPRAGTEQRGAILRVDGLVAECLKLTPADLERLPQQDFTDDFTCLEGWTVPGVKWGGVLLEIVLSLAKPTPEACYVQASAGEFSISLTRDQAEPVLLATRLHDKTPPEHGGPIRLVVPDGPCFTQIKWLDHLELRKEAGVNTAKRIAAGRLAGQESSI